MLVVARMVEVEGYMNCLRKSEYLNVSVIILSVLQRKPSIIILTYRMTMHDIEFGTVQR